MANGAMSSGRINAAEAAIVRRIFQLYDDGHGYTTIAKTLNDGGAPCPRPQRGRPKGWSSSSVRVILYSERYAGIVIYGKTKKRDASGKNKPSPRPESGWLVTKDETLRIVPEPLWNAVQAKLEKASERYAGQARRAARKHVLTGVLKCAICGAGYEAVTRAHGKTRKVFYGCSAFQRKGNKVCANNATITAERIEPAIIETIRKQALSERRIAALVARVVRRADSADVVEQVAGLRSRLKQLETEQARLVAAVTQGGEIEALTNALKERQREREKIATEIERLDAAPRPVNLREILTKRLRSSFLPLLERKPEGAQRALRGVISDRLVVAVENGKEGRKWRITGTVSLAPVVAGVLPHIMASPTGFARYRVFNSCGFFAPRDSPFVAIIRSHQSAPRVAPNGPFPRGPGAGVFSRRAELLRRQRPFAFSSSTSEGTGAERWRFRRCAGVPSDRQ